MKIFGRAACIEEVTAASAAAPLLTLIGPSGIGKTKLAEAFAEQTKANHVTAVVSLEQLASPSAATVTERIALALGLSAEQARDAATTPVQFETLLQEVERIVIDGADGLSELLATLVPSWLTTSPKLRIVVTARGPLRLSMETLFTVRPLHAEPCRELFFARAKSVAADFAPQSEAALARVLEATGGLPLAVELAAAQMRVKTCSELAAALEGNEHALDGGHQDAPSRHQSLSAAIATSVDTLSGHGTVAFELSGAFAGPFTRQALVAVAAALPNLLDGCSSPKEVEREVGRSVDELVDASLLVAERSSGEMRFYSLRPVRAFAANALSASSFGLAAKKAHALFFANAWMLTSAVASADVADLLLARATLVEDDSPEAPSLAAKCGLALVNEAVGRGAAADAAEHLALLPSEGLAPAIEAATICAHSRQAIVYAATSTTEELERATAALERATPATPLTEAVAVDLAALRALDARITGRNDVEEAFETALERAEKFGHAPWIHRIRSDFAAAMFERKNLAASKALFLDVLDETIEAGDKAGEGIARTNLALVHQEAGAFGAAEASMRQALDIHREVGHTRFAAITLSDLGALSVEQSHWLRAKDDYLAAIEALQTLGDRRHEAIGRSALAFVYALLGDVDQAEREARRAKRCLKGTQKDRFGLVLSIYECGQRAIFSAQRKLVDGVDVETDAIEKEINALVCAPLGEKTDEVRLAGRLVSIALLACTHSPLAVTLDGSTYWHQGVKVDVSEKKAHRGILAALIANRLTQANGLDKAAVIAAGWPEEKMVEASARNRLHVAIAGLRKAGLGDAIALVDGHYRLVPNVPLVVLH